MPDDGRALGWVQMVQTRGIRPSLPGTAGSIPPRTHGIGRPPIQRHRARQNEAATSASVCAARSLSSPLRYRCCRLFLRCRRT